MVVRFFNADKNIAFVITYLLPQAKLWSKRQTHHALEIKGLCGALRCASVQGERTWKRKQRSVGTYLFYLVLAKFIGFGPVDG